MLSRIAARITGSDLDRMLSPYASPPRRTPELLTEVLAANRAVELKSTEGPIVVAYRHRDPIIAARVANMLIDELFQWSSRIRIDRTIKQEEDIAITRDLLAKEVEQLSEKLVTSSSAGADETNSPDHAEITRKLAAAKEALAKAELRLKQTNLIPQWELQSARHATTATPPAQPVYPSHAMHLCIGLASGLFAGALTLLLMSPRRRPSPG